MIVFICLLVVLVCVISIFNARVIARKRFENVEENKATKVIKIAGYVVSVCMLGIIYIYMRQGEYKLDKNFDFKKRENEIYYRRYKE